MAKSKKQKNSWLALFLTICFFIVIIAFGIYALKHYENNSRYLKEKKVVVTPEALQKMYDQNGLTTNEQLNQSTVEIYGSVISINESNPNVITIGNKMSKSASSVQLNIKPVQRNLSMLISQSDQIIADCTDPKEIDGVPHLSNCSLKSIITPVYGQGTDSQLSISKDYSDYNGSSFATKFLMGIPQTLIFNAKINCHPRKRTLTDIFTIKKNENGKEEITNVANLDSHVAAQRKIIEANNEIKEMLQTLLNTKNNQNDKINSYIDQVCSLPVS